MTQELYLRVSLILNGLAIAVFFIIRTFLPPVLPVFFGNPVGASQLGSQWFLLLLPVTSLTIGVVNFLLMRIIQGEFLKKTLVISSFFISILGLVTFIKIILLVGSF